MSMEIVMTKKMEMAMELRRVPAQEAAGGPASGLGEELFEELKPERVQEWLQAFPAWHLGSTAHTLHRAKAFPTAEVAAQYGAFVTGLAGALGLPVRVSIVDGQSSLLLHAGRQHGRYVPLTEAVLAFAAEIG